MPQFIMSIRLRFIASLCIVLAMATTASRAASPTIAEVHVSPAGKDTNEGSAAAPFATPARAQDAMRASPMGASRRVVVHAGTYYLARSLALTKEDSGTAEHAAEWIAAPGEEVRLVGGVSVPADAFREVTHADTLARLQPAARDRVRCVDLAALGVAQLPPVPAKFRGAMLLPELFVNDERMTLARWPTKGWATVAKIIDTGSDPRRGDKDNRPGVFEYAGDAPNRWRVDAGVWLLGYWCFDWWDEAIRVKAIDAAKRQITLAEPGLYGLRPGNPSPRRFAAINILEELDAPGEYCVDVASRTLFFWPTKPLADAHVTISTLREPIVMMKDVSHLRFRGFTVEAGLTDGITATNCTRLDIQACHIRNMREKGIVVIGGDSNTVEACDIHDVGNTAILMEAGDRKTLTPGNAVAINNHAWRYARHVQTYACGIRMAGVGGRIANNLIHDAPHMAIGINGNDHVVEFNIVHDACLETDDAGAFYKGRNPSARGNIVRYNFWHHIGSPMGLGNAAIYFDDGDGGDSVIGNVFLRCGEPGNSGFGTIFSHGGHDLLADNNIFIECKRALGSTPWDDKRWKDTINGGQSFNWPKLLREDVDITSPPYTTHYPALVGFLDPKPGVPRVSTATRNVFVMCPRISVGNWTLPDKRNWSTNADPGFIDPARGDFRLRPDSPVFKQLADFKPIPMEKMGLVKNELRPTLPETPWKYAPLGATTPAASPSPGK